MNLNPFKKKEEVKPKVSQTVWPGDDFEVNPERANQNENPEEKVSQAEVDDALLNVLEQFAPEMVTPEERRRKEQSLKK